MAGLASVFCCVQAEDGIRDATVTGVQTCALPILELPQKNGANHGYPSLTADCCYRFRRELKAIFLTSTVCQFRRSFCRLMLETLECPLYHPHKLMENKMNMQKGF